MLTFDPVDILLLILNPCEILSITGKNKQIRTVLKNKNYIFLIVLHWEKILLELNL